MKAVFSCIALLLLFACTTGAQTIHDQSFKDVNGKDVSLRKYAGKKILIILVPTDAADSLFGRLQEFKHTYGDKIEVVGILCAESGNAIKGSDKIMKMNKDAPGSFSSPMITRKGPGQAALMKWLTDKNGNKHFDQDARGPGQKYFISASGQLYAVIGPEVPISSPSIARIVNAPVK